MKSAKAATAMMAGNKLLKNSPITKAVKAPIQAAGTAAVLGLSKAKRRSDLRDKNIEKRKKKEENKNTDLTNIAAEIERLRAELGKKYSPASKSTAAFKDFRETFLDGDRITPENEEAMETELADLELRVAEAVMNSEGP